MHANQVHEYAVQLIDVYGDKAEVQAAKQAREYLSKGDKDQAQIWTRVQQTISTIKGPPVS